MGKGKGLELRNTPREGLVTQNEQLQSENLTCQRPGKVVVSFSGRGGREEFRKKLEEEGSKSASQSKMINFLPRTTSVSRFTKLFYDNEGHSICQVSNRTNSDTLVPLCDVACNLSFITLKEYFF